MKRLRMELSGELLLTWQRLAPMKILINVPSASTPSPANLSPHQRTVNITFVLTASLNGQTWVYPNGFLIVENIILNSITFSLSLYRNEKSLVANKSGLLLVFFLFFSA